MLSLKKVLLIGAFLLSGCQTTQDDKKPEISKDMPIAEAYGFAKSYGGDIMTKVKELAKERKELPKLAGMTENDLLNNNSSMSFAELSHTTNMYVYSSQKAEPKVIQALLSAKSPEIRKVGWRLASVKPSPAVVTVIDGILNKALTENREDEILDPDMARALQENEMKNAYSFLERGLSEQGAPEYATAMLALEPKNATPAFLNYLMRADLDDLRQLNQKSVNIYTCTVIFRFLIENPIPVTHPGVPALFLFAVSRNRGLADMANAVLEKQIPENRTQFAMILARLPVPVQVAFIENTQREMTANLRLLLHDLKDHAQNKEVLEELNSPNEGAQ